MFEVSIRRVIQRGGRSRTYVNGALTTAARLAELGALLIDLSGQHQHQGLVDPGRHLQLIDATDIPRVRDVFARHRDFDVVLLAFGGLGNQELAERDGAEARRIVDSNFTGAVSDYNRLLAMDKLYPRIYSKRAGSEAMLSQAEDALRDAEKALQVDPKDEEAYNSRGLANRLLGRLDEAVNDFSLAIHIKHDYSRPYNNRGTVFLAQGQPEKALGDFDKAIELDSHFADPYSNRGSAQHQLGRDEAALMDLDAALRLNPDFADAYQNRGVIKNSLKLFPEALADFNQALKLKPDTGGVLLGRGISKFYVSDNTGSCEDWRTASADGATDAAALISEYCK